MVIHSQMGIDPKFSVKVKDISELKAGYESLVGGWTIQAKKKLIRKGVRCSVLAVFRSDNEAASEMKRIVDSIKIGLNEYRINGKSEWDGPENELIIAPRRMRV